MPRQCCHAAACRARLLPALASLVVATILAASLSTARLARAAPERRSLVVHLAAEDPEGEVAHAYVLVMFQGDVLNAERWPTRLAPSYSFSSLERRVNEVRVLTIRADGDVDEPQRVYPIGHSCVERASLPLAVDVPVGATRAWIEVSSGRFAGGGAIRPMARVVDLQETLPETSVRMQVGVGLSVPGQVVLADGNELRAPGEGAVAAYPVRPFVERVCGAFNLAPHSYVTYDSESGSFEFSGLSPEFDYRVVARDGLGVFSNTVLVRRGGHCDGLRVPIPRTVHQRIVVELGALAAAHDDLAVRVIRRNNVGLLEDASAPWPLSNAQLLPTDEGIGLHALDSQGVVAVPGVRPGESYSVHVVAVRRTSGGGGVRRVLGPRSGAGGDGAEYRFTGGDAVWEVRPKR